MITATVAAQRGAPSSKPCFFSQEVGSGVEGKRSIEKKNWPQVEPHLRACGGPSQIVKSSGVGTFTARAAL